MSTTQLCNNAENLKEEIWAIIHPDPEDIENLNSMPPHKRLNEHFGLDTSYFQPSWSIKGDRKYDVLIEAQEDPLNKVIESISVPTTLIDASLNLFAESMINYCFNDKKWGVYRYFPSILMTMWSAFESLVRINSELFIHVTVDIPAVVANALMEERPCIKNNLKIGQTIDRFSTLDRYWLLLKYACDIEYDRGSIIWQNGEAVVKARNELVHYRTSKAPTLTMREIWEHIEAILLLLIGPSTVAKRTLFSHQYGYHSIIVELLRFIVDFEERPLHKGLANGPTIIYCPFDNVNEKKYPKYHNVEVQNYSPVFLV